MIERNENDAPMNANEVSYKISEQDLMSLERIFKDADGLKYQFTFASRVYATLFPILSKHLELEEKNNK